jgi:hypothetical protein
MPGHLGFPSLRVSLLATPFLLRMMRNLILKTPNIVPHIHLRNMKASFFALRTDLRNMTFEIFVLRILLRNMKSSFFALRTDLRNMTFEIFVLRFNLRNQKASFFVLRTANLFWLLVNFIYLLLYLDMVPVYFNAFW